MKGRILYEGTQMSLCYPCFSGSTTKTKLKISTTLQNITSGALKQYQPRSKCPLN